MINKKQFDDGNWLWHYECKYTISTNEQKDWYYYISFETPEGGYLNEEEITCYYWDQENILKIYHNKSEIKFYVENFQDIKKILLPLIKAHKAIPYPIYESKIKQQKEERFEKITKINERRR